MSRIVISAIISTSRKSLIGTAIIRRFLLPSTAVAMSSYSTDGSAGRGEDDRLGKESKVKHLISHYESNRAAVARTSKAVSYNKSGEVIDCLFCRIHQGLEPSTIVDEDSNFVVFKSISPASPSAHLLVTPREHIKNMHSLVPSDVDMLEKMVEFGSKSLRMINPDFVSDAQFCFHKPPINSIDHLHLHCIAQPSTMYLWGSIAYGKYSPVCVPVNTVIADLKAKAAEGGESSKITRDKLFLYKS